MLKSVARAALAAFFVIPANMAPADSDPGSYLAARQAALSNDFAVAARYYTQSLLSDPDNPSLLENAMRSYVLLGQIDQAVPIAGVMRDIGVESQLGNLVLMASAVEAGDWNAIFTALEEGHTISPLVDGLMQAWATLGQGDMTGALSTFDTVIEGEGMRTFGAYHKALALGSVGDFEAAEAILAGVSGGGSQLLTVRGAVGYAQILSQLGRNDDALTMLDAMFGVHNDPTITTLQVQLAAGETVPFSLVKSPRDGASEVAFMVASLLDGEATDRFTLQYARIAQYLNPQRTDAIMLSADLLDELGRYSLASDTYALVPADSPAFPAAEMGRIEALRQIGEDETAIEVARNLTRTHPELPFVHAKLADTLRSTSDFEGAFDAYSRALDLYADDDPVRWRVLFTRAISSHALDNWPEAEADFRAALDLRPDQPQVLNYLGYSLVERGEKLDEALQMIETAVAAQPDNGAIVDSLGWVLFQLGRYEEAVVHMERAASLEAVDPIINDHLGDVYWAVGREVEAAFQWHRALSFNPEPELAERIRRKLEVGLDTVLEEEGADPIQMANDEG